MSYKAFISYSHAADGALAPALQSGLQRIAKPFYRLRAMRVFRDETSLQVTPALWAIIRKSLSESENFILMSSPDAAKSKWVQAEINEWLKLKNNSLDNFSIVLTEGEIVWDDETNDFDWEKTTALPNNLQAKFSSEPLYLDFRWAKSSEHLSIRNPRFLNSIGKLASAIRNEPLDSIVGEDVKQHRIFKAITSGTIGLLLLLLFATSYAAYYANKQTTIANERKAEADRQRDDAIRARNETTAALERETQARELAETQRKEAEQAKKNETTAKEQAEERRIQAVKSAENERAARKDAETQTVKTNEAVRTLLLESGRQELTNHNPLQAVAYLSESFKMDKDPGKTSSLRFLLGLSMRSVDSVRFSVSYGENINSAKFSPDGNRIAIAGADDTRGTVNTARVVEVKTGNEILNPLTNKTLDPVKHGADVNTAEFSLDSKRIVTSSDDNYVTVLDLETGKDTWFEYRIDVKSAKFSPDGRKIATVDDKGRATIRNIETGKDVFVETEEILDSLKNERYVKSVEFSPDIKRIVIVDEYSRGDVNHGGVIVLDFETRGVVALLEHQRVVNSAEFSPDSRQLVTASDDTTVQVLDLETGKPIPLPHQAPVVSAEFSPDGKRIVTITSDNKAHVWNIETKKEVTSVQHQNRILSAKFSTDGKQIVTASWDKTAKVWDVETGEMLASLPHSSFVKSAEFSPDGKQIVTASHDKTVKLWNVETGIVSSVPHGDRVTSARFTNKESKRRRMVTASYDKTAKVVDMETGKITELPHEDKVRSAEFSPDGARVVTSSGKTARIWDLETTPVIPTVLPIKHSDTCWTAEFSPDGTQVVTSSRDRTAKVLDLKTGRIISLEHQDQVNTAKFSPDGKQIVTTTGDVISPDGRAYVWDVKKIWDEKNWNIKTVWEVDSKEAIATVPHQGGVISAEFSPNGKRIVTASFDGTAKVYNLETKETATIQHLALVVSAKFSSDGKRIVTASDDSTAIIWDVETAKVVTSVQHQNRVRSAKFSPDGKQIVTASADKTAKVWDAETGRLLASIEHRELVRSAEFSPDGEQIVTASFDKTSKVWSFPRETRTSKEIEEIVGIKVPFSLENGTLVPHQAVFFK
jgi:WD40 repeat protein